MLADILLPLSGLFVLAAAFVVAWLALRRRTRTRFAVQRQVHEDVDITQWIVAFDWTSKILYLPSLIATLAAAGVMLAVQFVSSMPHVPGSVVGGIWLTVVVLNVLIEEGSLGWKGLVALAAALGFAAGWLNLAGWMKPVMSWLCEIRVSLSAGAYVIVAAVGLLALLASWLRGLFTFVVVTPRYVVIGRGLLSVPEQLPLDAVTVEADRSDLLKRLVGFGHLVVTFRDTTRPAIVMLVGHVGAKAEMLKALRRQVDRDASIFPAREVPAPSVNGKTEETAEQ